MGVGKVCGVSGLILLPDTWSGDGLKPIKKGSSSFNDNVYASEDDWNAMKSKGAVFLPAAGEFRHDTIIYSVGGHGFYWTSTPNNDKWNNFYIGVDQDYVGTSIRARNIGHSIRLVQDVK